MSRRPWYPLRDRKKKGQSDFDFIRYLYKKYSIDPGKDHTFSNKQTIPKLKRLKKHQRFILVKHENSYVILEWFLEEERVVFSIDHGAYMLTVTKNYIDYNYPYEVMDGLLPKKKSENPCYGGSFLISLSHKILLGFGYKTSHLMDGSTLENIYRSFYVPFTLIRAMQGKDSYYSRFGYRYINNTDLVNHPMVKHLRKLTLKKMVKELTTFSDNLGKFLYSGHSLKKAVTSDELGEHYKLFKNYGRVTTIHEWLAPGLDLHYEEQRDRRWKPEEREVLAVLSVCGKLMWFLKNMINGKYSEKKKDGEVKGKKLTKFSQLFDNLEYSLVRNFLLLLEELNYQVYGFFSIRFKEKEKDIEIVLPEFSMYYLYLLYISQSTMINTNISKFTVCYKK